MAQIIKKSIADIALNFIPEEFNENKDDPFYYRNIKKGKVKCRNLHAHEIEVLIKNNNCAEDWNTIMVTDLFDPNLVKNCEFFGKITIGKLEKLFLEFNDLRLPVGLYNSTIVSCDIGDNVVIRNVHFLSHYMINNESILFNINEMITTGRAKFGNGILKEGESEDIRIWLEICNENEGRKILPFDNMIPADAYLWSRHRHDSELMEKFKQITCNQYDKKHGYYGTVGTNCVIKNCSIIKDVKIEDYAYIKGANKLKNLTILSSKLEPSQIGEGVEMVNGIVGYGSKVFYGCKAVRFVMGRNTQLKYGARLLNSVLGDNSTVSCCELLNNLIFPFHEQHHNTSFLVAATLLGQTNIAAGATIGSNHNSRAADGEIIAGRGFWPGLCTNFKHNCRFASFVLVAKGSYQYEMNIDYPFSLVVQSAHEDAITIMPAYWFMYNMYAIARNLYKFKKRDKRKIEIQHIEFDYLAPDTVSEMLHALAKLKYKIGAKLYNIEDVDIKKEKIITIADDYLNNSNNCDELELFDKEAMNKYGAKIIKPVKAIKVYEEMCFYFIAKSILSYLQLDKMSLITKHDFMLKINDLYAKKLYTKWQNLGGQIVPEEAVNALLNRIKMGSLESWDKIHDCYNQLWKKYPEHKARFALHALESITNKEVNEYSNNDWMDFFTKSKSIINKVLDQAIRSREKDYENTFIRMVYDSEEEMRTVLGNLEENWFLNELKKDTDTMSNRIAILEKLYS